MVVKAILPVLILALGLTAVVYLVSRPQIFTNQASESAVRLTTLPQTAPLPSTVKVWLDPVGNPVIAAKIVLSFDNTKIKLSKDPSISQPFDNVLSITSATEANATGEIVLAAGLNPAITKSPLVSSSEFATLSFIAASETVTPDSNNVTFVKNASQVLTKSGTPATITVLGSKLYTAISPTPISPNPNQPPGRNPPPANSLICTINITPNYKVTPGVRKRLEAVPNGGQPPFTYTWSISSQSNKGSLSSYGPYPIVLWTPPSKIDANQSWQFIVTMKDSAGKQANCAVVVK